MEVTLEGLQSMSDRELDELAALRVMKWTEMSKQHDGYIFRGDTEGAIVLSPTEDMNDAYELLQQFMDWSISINHGLGDWICRLSEGYIEGAVNVEAESESLPRAITIAAILTKQEV